MSDTLIIPNSIWPNGMKVDSDGYAVFYPLGTNKIEVPTSSSEWPKGNRFISNFVYQDDKLVGLVDTKALTVSGNATIYLPYEHIEAHFSEIEKGQLQIHAPNATTKKVSWKDSGVEDIPEAQFKYKGCKTFDDVIAVDSNYLTNDIVDGTWSELLCDLEDSNSTGYSDGGMFYNCSNLTTFTSDLSSLTDGEYMFGDCRNLTTFTSDLSSLTNGNYMFGDCDNLTSFSSDLSSLRDVSGMFYSCNNLTSFTSDLSSLIKGVNMFYQCKKLTTFTSDLSSLTNGNYMFYYCENLATFNSDLSSFTYGYGTFYNCSKLTTFTSDLSSLTNGNMMFYNCKLDTDSIIHIAETIKDVRSLINMGSSSSAVYKTIHIGIGNTSPNAEETEAFTKMVEKGWTVYVNGKSNSNLFTPAALIPIDGEEQQTPIPFWAKPVPSDEEHARYVDAQGNFFDILGGQFIYGDDITVYGMFTCEEDAAAQMSLTPYVKPQTKIERN